MAKLADPISGTKLLPDYPSLRQLRQACEHLHAPILREQERAASHAEFLRQRALPRPPRTEDEQARIDAQVARVKREIAQAQIDSEQKG